MPKTRTLKATPHQTFLATLRRTGGAHRALCYLQQARAELKAADCPQTLRKVRSAIKSCEGALRNAERWQEAMMRDGGQS